MFKKRRRTGGAGTSFSAAEALGTGVGDEPAATEVQGAVEEEKVASEASTSPSASAQPDLKVAPPVAAKPPSKNQQVDGTNSESAKPGALGHSFASTRSAKPAEYGGGAFARDLLHSADDPSSTTNNEPAKGVQGDAKATQPERKRFGPIRAPANLRVTSRFDYQPDVCKDYKETGYCGYGDNCIFLHDRGNYKTGYELDQEWKAKQKEREAALARGEKLLGDDQGSEDRSDKAKKAKIKEEIPFACHICRKPFKRPVVTLCKHYFCQKCAFKQYGKSSRCAVCGEQTKGIFNAATALKEPSKQTETT